MLRGERNGACSAQCLRQPGEHGQIGVEADALDAPDAEHRQAVGVLQPAELALGAVRAERDRLTVVVEVSAPAVRVRFALAAALTAYAEARSSRSFRCCTFRGISLCTCRLAMRGTMSLPIP
jgi:hypothetical protein